jgi:hypothetical protein
VSGIKTALVAKARRKNLEGTVDRAGYGSLCATDGLTLAGIKALSLFNIGNPK